VGGVGVTDRLIGTLLLLVGAGLLVCGVLLLWGPAWALLVSGVLVMSCGVLLVVEVPPRVVEVPAGDLTRIPGR
jgi:hypothetical protein